MFFLSSSFSEIFGAKFARILRKMEKVSEDHGSRG
jgi:hypothetical protein